MGAVRRGSRQAIVLSAAGLALVGGAPAVAAEPPGRLSANAARQIDALQDIKRSLSPAERKLDSRLAVTLRQRAGKAPAAARTPRLTVGVAVSASGTTEVDVRSDAFGPDLVSRLVSIGATIRHASPREGSIRAAVPLTALETVAAWKDVRRVDVAGGAMTAHRTIGAPKRESKAARSARVERRLQAALAAPPAAGPQGDVVSEGDKAHAADLARAAHRVTGTGVKMCALSDGVDSLDASEAAGELPDVDVLPGEGGSGDEGTAMLEILHDIAPGAELGFATAFTSLESFADNIRALRFTAGCDIIVDDVLYFAEGPFQDGPIARAVNAVAADGALYFSSAGNAGNTLDGTSGNYEGNFVDSGQGVGRFVGAAHDFAPGAAKQVFEPLSDDSGAGVPVTLHWADPLGHAADDYDLYLFDADGNVLSFAQGVQDGDDDPFEILGTTGDAGSRLAVVRYSGAARYLQLSALGGRFEDAEDGLVARVRRGVIRGHAAARPAFGTAAAPADEPLPFDLEPGDPANPSGPFPNPFAATQAPERFTSDGPRRMFFTPAGAPLRDGGVVRRKPDITAADGVSTSLDDFAPFFGTSAAAPHAAAIAGLVLSGNPGLPPADVREAFEATALDLAPAGFDSRAGAGLVRADRVLAYTGATPQPLVRAGTATVTPTTGDGDEFLEPGEAGSAQLEVTNVGDGTATGTSVRVTSDDPRAVVTPRTRPYGDLRAGATRGRAFTLALADDYPLGRPVALHVTVTFAGVLSPTDTHVPVPTGEPATTPTDFAYTGPPVAIPDASDVGASVAVPVDGLGYASNLTFSIDGATCTATEGATTVGIDHTFAADLVGMLTAPDGTAATLFAGDGGGGNNLCQVEFDDTADEPFSSVASADEPFTGSWRPSDPLADLLTGPADGTWTFKVIDDAADDTGSIRKVSLHLKGFVDD